MILILDNYDSFTHNIAHMLGGLGLDCRVVANDAITVEEIEKGYQALIISPGPGNPDQAGISMRAIRHLGHKMPILGVCLGHQALAQVFGAEIVPAPAVCHGKTSRVWHNGRGLFSGLPQPLRVMRYHSLMVKKNSLPAELEVSAHTEDGVIMALQHRSRPLCSVQFHPESVLSEAGEQLFKNFYYKMIGSAGYPAGENRVLKQTLSC